MEGYPALSYLSQLLDATGDGTGSSDGAVNGSVAAVTLKVGPAAGFVYGIDQLIVAIEDNAAVVWDGYGAIAAPGLTNGCLLRVVKNSTIEVNLLAGQTVKRTFDWARVASRWGTERTTTNGLTVFHIKLDTRLILAPGRWLEFVIQDDLSSLEAHTILARGIIDEVPTYS
jgi:hypothetical protein